MQGSQGAALLYLGDGVVVYQRGRREILASVSHAMAHSIDVVERAENALDGVQKHLQNHGDALGMIVDREFLEHVVATGNLMCDGGVVGTDTLYQTFCQKREFAVALHIQNLILDRRRTAVENQNIHI